MKIKTKAMTPKNKVTRTKYMQRIMNETYSGIAIEAIKNGFDGCWERCISKRLRTDVSCDNSEAVVILESCDQDYMKAASLIYNSLIQKY